MGEMQEKDVIDGYDQQYADQNQNVSEAEQKPVKPEQNLMDTEQKLTEMEHIAPVEHAAVGKTDPVTIPGNPSSETLIEINKSLAKLNREVDSFKELNTSLPILIKKLNAASDVLKTFSGNEFKTQLKKSCDDQQQQFIKNCTEEYRQLVEVAVKNFRQFSNQATAWQKALENKSNSRSKTLAILIYLNPVLTLLLLAYIVFRR
jgi:Mg2+ and Co2+ transporter CorA